MTFQVLYEDNHLLVINKPAGWVTQGALPDQESVVTHVADYLRQKYSKPGNVFVGIVSRLDALVTGALPLARTSKCAARLSEQIRERSMKKIYWAWVEGRMPSEEGTLEHWLVRRESELVTTVHQKPVQDAMHAILHYRKLGESGGNDWLEIDLETGRKHQIRAQLSFVGCPIQGDHRYGAKGRTKKGIGLHCRSVTFLHPTTKVSITCTADVPS